MHLCLIFDHQLARPMCMVPNIPGIPGPPLGGSSSGSNSPSGYSIHSEAKMVSTRLALYFYLFICSFCLHLHPPAFRCTGLGPSSYDLLLWLLVYVTLSPDNTVCTHFMIVQCTHRDSCTVSTLQLCPRWNRVCSHCLWYLKHKVSPLAHSSVCRSPSLL